MPVSGLHPAQVQARPQRYCRKYFHSNARLAQCMRRSGGSTMLRSGVRQTSVPWFSASMMHASSTLKMLLLLSEQIRVPGNGIG